MRAKLRFVVPFVGAGALLASAFTGALASRPGPFQDYSRSGAVKSFTVGGRLTVTDVLRVQKNTSVYGKLYAHGGEQIWTGLLVHNGGIKSDSLEVTGPIQVQSATISGNLQAATIQAPTINGATL